MARFLPSAYFVVPRSKVIVSGLDRSDRPVTYHPAPIQARACAYRGVFAHHVGPRAWGAGGRRQAVGEGIDAVRAKVTRSCPPRADMLATRQPIARHARPRVRSTHHGRSAAAAGSSSPISVSTAGNVSVTLVVSAGRAVR